MIISFIKKCHQRIISLENSIVVEKTDISASTIAKTKINVTVREVKNNELKDILNNGNLAFFGRHNVTKKAIEKRMRRNQICVGAFSGDVLCGCSWLSSNHIKDITAKESEMLPSDTAYIFDVFVLPEFRGQGIAPALYSCQSDLAKNTSCDRVLAIHSKWNRASGWALAKAGFNRIGEIFIVTIFNKHKLIWTRKIKKDMVKTIECLRGEKF